MDIIIVSYYVHTIKLSHSNDVKYLENFQIYNQCIIKLFIKYRNKYLQYRIRNSSNIIYFCPSIN